MANRLTMSPELSEAVERARQGACEAGEFLDPPSEPFRSPLSPEVQAVLREWRDILATFASFSWLSSDNQPC